MHCHWLITSGIAQAAPVTLRCNMAAMRFLARWSVVLALCVAVAVAAVPPAWEHGHVSASSGRRELLMRPGTSSGFNVHARA